MAATAIVELLLGRATESAARLTRELEAGGAGRAGLELALAVGGDYSVDSPPCGRGACARSSMRSPTR